MKMAQRWHSELLQTARDLEKVKKLNVKLSESTNSLGEMLDEEASKPLDSSEIVITEEDEVRDDLQFVFTFASPQI